MYDRCPNMNHGRLNAPVRYCPSCGVSINAQAKQCCNSARHAEQRRNRLIFCHDCGKKLSALG